MRNLVLVLALASCGAPVYVPAEPPARKTAGAPTADTGVTPPPVHTGDPAAPHTGDPGTLPPWGCSTNDGYSTNAFVNNLTARTLDVYWVDAACVESYVATLAPQGTTGLYTWTHHVFVARDPTSGEAVSDFRVTTAGSTWEITE